jgi:hypothetical protein
MGEYRLTRRGALVALAAVTGGTAAGVALSGGGEDDTPPDDDGDGRPDPDADPESPLTAADRRTIRALARTLYPGAVTNVDAFVNTYLAGRAAEDAEWAAGMAEAVAALDDHATAWHDVDFAALDAETRDEALRTFGVDGADPDPAGTRVERVRHYLVDDLLLALYSSPTGGELVGLENPPGHPGGLASYSRGPAEE